MLLDNKVVVVAGVGAGLGREIVRLALRDGARVVMGARSEDVLATTAGSLDPSGERIAYEPMDITDSTQCEALAATAVEAFGRVDAVIQVAAYDRAFGRVEEADFGQWAKSFETNIIGTMTLVRAMLPALRAAGGGAVVLIGSQSMYIPQLPQAGYAASKGGLLSAMYYLADELGPDGIRVNMVIPSWMWGPPVEGYVRMRARAEGRSEDEVIAELTRRIPLGRIVPDEDVAEAALLLASERTRSITGQSLLVNGGEMMR
jgi:NAD(P)-dependent dehydrogenase (short-subunit alcohol dehydrogenase family)